MTREEFIQNEKYNYLFYYADPNNTGNTIYPISLGFEFSQGWDEMVFELLDKIVEIDTKKAVRIFQLKEKFASLRCYISITCDEDIPYDNEIYELIDQYETKSFTICEECGNPGKPRRDIGWHRTLCDKHYKEVKKPKQKVINVVVNAPVIKTKMS